MIIPQKKKYPLMDSLRRFFAFLIRNSYSGKKKGESLASDRQKKKMLKLIYIPNKRKISRKLSHTYLCMYVNVLCTHYIHC